MDKCLTAWYAYMRPQLLEQVNPENTSKDVWESLLEANHHYQIPGKVGVENSGDWRHLKKLSKHVGISRLY